MKEKYNNTNTCSCVYKTSCLCVVVNDLRVGYYLGKWVKLKNGTTGELGYRRKKISMEQWKKNLRWAIRGLTQFLPQDVAFAGAARRRLAEKLGPHQLTIHSPLTCLTSPKSKTIHHGRGHPCKLGWMVWIFYALDHPCCVLYLVTLIHVRFRFHARVHFFISVRRLYMMPLSSTFCWRMQRWMRSV